MAFSGSVARQPRPFSRSLRMTCLVQFCLLWRMVSHEPPQLPFVQGNPWSVRNAEVTERYRQQRQAMSIEKLNGVEPTEKLIEILSAALDGKIYTPSHALAAYNALVKLKRQKRLTKKHWESPVLHRLHTKVQDMVSRGQLNDKASVKVLHCLGDLSDRFHIPLQLLVALVESLLSKVQKMDRSQVGVFLTACTKFKDNKLAFDYLVPAVAVEIRKGLWTMSSAKRFILAVNERLFDLLHVTWTKFPGLRFILSPETRSLYISGSICF